MTEQQDQVTVTIDGVELQAPKNAMVIEVADQAGISIPRFCYHKHLSVAANCRMCMVEVEKAPKPLPACATPVSDGMKIFTHSKLAIDAQKGTMEFLLINHPLDCPVCDQGGECELQDVAIGYGGDVSRFTERKRVVADKNIGSLISTDMTRCIHCTRCVRFGDEIAGVRELGATGRGEFMEIGTYIEKSLASELSGNVIDLCPVGALNAKPSRMRGRAWEMLEYEAISPHDAVGSNLSMHVIRNEVMRVVPKENAAINQTWISDRDRFSYEGMYSQDRLKHVMRKAGDTWQTVRWSDALQSLAKLLKEYESEEVGILVSPNQSNEEIYLLQKLARALGINNIDHRVERVDFADQNNDPLFPWLGLNINDLEQQDVVIVIGSDLRSEQPMIMHRLRKAAMHGSKVVFINPHKFEYFAKLAAELVVRPQDLLPVLTKMLASIDTGSKQPKWLEGLNSNEQVDLANYMSGIDEIISLLRSEGNTCLLLGSLVDQHEEYSALRAVAQRIAEMTNSSFGYLPIASNAAGASLLGALPHRAVMGEEVSESGMNYTEMLNSPRKLFILFGLEPSWDCTLPAQCKRALEQAEHVVALTSFRSEDLEPCCDWMLPVSCYAEAEGTKINIEGRWQYQAKLVEANDDVKDAWKVLRMLATELGLANFEYNDLHEVKNEITSHIDSEVEFSNALSSEPTINPLADNRQALYRVSSKPIYSIDSLVRRAPSLQAAQDNADAVLRINQHDIDKYGLHVDGWVRVTQGEDKSILKCVMDNNLLPGSAYIANGLVRSEKLGTAFGSIKVKNLSV